MDHPLNDYNFFIPITRSPIEKLMEKAFTLAQNKNELSAGILKHQGSLDSQEIGGRVS